jgi:hypothetical protein
LRVAELRQPGILVVDRRLRRNGWGGVSHAVRKPRRGALRKFQILMY